MSQANYLSDNSYDQSTTKIKRRHVVDQCNERRNGLRQVLTSIPALFRDEYLSPVFVKHIHTVHMVHDIVCLCKDYLHLHVRTVHVFLLVKVLFATSVFCLSQAS